MPKYNNLLITNIYRKNETNNKTMIEVSLDDYDELFNGWDASLLKRKELEPELMEYLKTASTEIRLKDPIELWFYIDETLRDETKEQTSIEGIRYNFKLQVHLIQTKLKLNYRKIGIYIIMSVLFLLLAYLIPARLELSLLFSILMEGLFIGGWVLLWEAFSLFFFSSHELRMSRAHYYKLYHSNIYFTKNKL